MKNDFLDSLKLLEGFTSLGEKYMANGTHLIGRAPHIAPMAWLHAIYPPLTNNEIKELELLLKTNLSGGYNEFLLISNGLTVYCGTLDNCTFFYNDGSEITADLVDFFSEYDSSLKKTVVSQFEG